jgi:Nucleotidyl transferase AbiEii toxin, Type IV TA system
MPGPRTYKTAAAFRRAFEERIGRISRTEQIDVNRLRRQASFDRLLARLFHRQPAPWALKGGYALELRFQSARSTIDIDLTVRRLPQADRDQTQTVREMLQEAAALDLGDWFEYRIGSQVMDLAAAPYGGARFPVERAWTVASLAGFTWTQGSATF